jgi:hypothetical protein
MMPMGQRNVTTLPCRRSVKRSLSVSSSDVPGRVDSGVCRSLGAPATGSGSMHTWLFADAGQYPFLVKLLIVTNAKPHGWPVSRSVTTLTSGTPQNWQENGAKNAAVTGLIVSGNHSQFRKRLIQR